MTGAELSKASSARTRDEPLGTHRQAPPLLTRVGTGATPWLLEACESEPTDRSKAVFVSDSADMNLPFEELAEVLLDRTGVWSTRLSDPAVTVIAGPPRVHDESVIVPITWEPDAYGRLLSTIEADLKLTSLAGHRSRAALSGRYLVGAGSSPSDLIAARRVADSLFANLLEYLETMFRDQRSTTTELRARKVNRASGETSRGGGG